MELCVQPLPLTFFKIVFHVHNCLLTSTEPPDPLPPSLWAGDGALTRKAKMDYCNRVQSGLEDPASSGGLSWVTICFSGTG